MGTIKPPERGGSEHICETHLNLLTNNLGVIITQFRVGVSATSYNSWKYFINCMYNLLCLSNKNEVEEMLSL